MSKSSNKLVCAANPCPITLSAACVFYEGPNLVCSGVSTNMTVENALQEINKRLCSGAGADGTSGTEKSRG